MPLTWPRSNWALTGGQTYYLISELPSNGRWTTYTPGSQSNAHISVGGAYQIPSHGPLSYWFSFTSLKTTDTPGGVVPEPGSLALLGLGIGGLALLRRRLAL